MHRVFKLLKWTKVVGVSIATLGLSASAFVVGNCVAHVDPTGMPISVTKWDFNWDKKKPKDNDDDIQESFATRHIILIRHANSCESGKCDQKLTPLGREQAELTARRLKKLGVKFSRFVCSECARAQETARIIHSVICQEGLSVHPPDPWLNEGVPYPPDPPIPGNPDIPDGDGSRIESAFRKYFHRADFTQDEDSYEIIVCHGNVIRYFFCRALQLPPEAWMRMNIHQASITFFSIFPSGRVASRGLGDCGHIPNDKITIT